MLIENEEIAFDIFIEALRQSTPHNLSSLMKMYKGNHYFFICREQDKLTSNDENALSRERAMSYENGNINTKVQPTKMIRKNNYKRLIQKMFIFTYNKSDEATRKSIQTISNIKHMTENIKVCIQRFIDSRGSDYYSTVRYIIHARDTALRSNKIKESEIDASLLKLINEAKQIMFKTVA